MSQRPLSCFPITRAFAVVFSLQLLGSPSFAAETLGACPPQPTRADRLP